jgi:ubiquinone/menaquinone biosynthesis C-methylase UbiE
MGKTWMIDESAHAGPDHLDPAFVAVYDEKQGHPDPEEDLSLFAAHGLDRTSTIVDLGAGTGQFALAAATRFGHVTAVDVSPAMLRLLGDRVSAEGLTNLDCVQGGFLSYEHVGAPADGVYTRNALHHIPDFWKALALQRIAGIMRPGAVLRIRDLIYDVRPSEVDDVFDRWLSDAVDQPALGYTRADLIEHIRTEYSTFRWLLEPMIAAAGLEIETAEFHRSVYGAYTCVKR